MSSARIPEAAESSTSRSEALSEPMPLAASRATTGGKGFALIE